MKKETKTANPKTTNQKTINRNKAILIGFALLIFFSFAVPIYQAMSRFFEEKPVFLYYYQPSWETPAGYEIGNYAVYCQVFDRIEKTSGKNPYKNLISQALLLPKDVTLSNNNNDKVRILSAFREKNLLMLNFSSEFYKLDEREERNTITAMLIAIAANHPEIEEVSIRVEGNDIKSLNGIFNYAVPFLMAKIFEENLPFESVLLHKRSKKTAQATLFQKRKEKLVGTMLDEKIIIKPC